MITVDDLRALELFTGVTDEQLQTLVESSREVVFAPGDVLWVEGQSADCWWVLIEGQVELTRLDENGRAEVVGGFDAPGRWAGGFQAWDEAGLYLASGHATSVGRMMCVPADALRQLFAAYPLAARLIQGLFRTARSIEATARERHALASLGRVSAGLAHELNNPIAAAARAVDLMSKESDALLSSLRELAESGVTSEHFTELDELRSELHPRQVTDDRALAAAEDELAEWFDDHDIDRGWVLAPALAAGGADIAWCERVTTQVPERALPSAFAWVAAAVQLASLLGEVREATRRASSLIADAKSYTQMDRALLQRVDITEGLDSTVTMLGGRLAGVNVVRDYSPDVPPVEVSASELNQVWTNLISNAVDAMHGAGTLRISTATLGDRLVVEIADSGDGIPSDVANKIFEPFFTTKGVGGGTGLGLDISRRIVVDSHGGSITVASEPGNTVFRVEIPFTQPER